MNQRPMSLAARAHLMSTIIATTGLMTLSSTAKGYARADGGSFLDDGFVPGLEITPAGFSANEVDVVTHVTALQLSTLGSHPVQVAAADRSLIAKPPRAMRFGARKPTDVDV